MRNYLFFVCLFVNCNNAFLLGDKGQTPGTPSPVLSDKHFAMLLDILNDEKQSRVKLETKVELLEKKLLATQQGVTDIYYSGVQNNATLEHCMVDLSALTAKVSQLEKTNDLLQKSLHDIQTKQEMVQNTVHQTTQELESIKHLKTVTDMTLVLNIQNQTTQLAKEVQQTNNNMNSIQNDVNARKQDFVALFQKAVSTDNSVVQLKNNLSQFQNLSKTELEGSMNNIRNQIFSLDTRQNVSSGEIKKTFQSEMLVLRSELNKTDSKLNTQIHNTTKQAFTACARSNTYTSGSVIPFTDIRTENGFNTGGLNSLRNTGKFTCQSPGLYLISVFVTSYTKGAFASLYKNNEPIAYDFVVPNGSNHETSTVTVLQDLSVNDTIYVKAGHDMYVYGFPSSSISVLQIIAK